jgi:transketolase
MNAAPLTDLRDAFFGEIYRIGAADPRVVIITNDMDVFALARFRADFPARFINVGVAEQNMINVAAGLASCGRRPVVFGIAAFVLFRCFEQIKVNVCGMNLPVLICGVGTGLAFAFDGPTHHGMQDLAVARALPELAIYNPGDVGGALLAARAAMALAGPAYARIDKGPFPTLVDARDDAVVARGWAVLRPQRAVTLLATGSMTPAALAVADLLAARGIAAGVVDVHRVKPLDADGLGAIARQSRLLVTLEEHALAGGFGAAIGELLLDAGIGVRLLRLAGSDRQTLLYGARDWLLRQEALDVATLVRRIAAAAEAAFPVQAAG